MRTLGGQFVPGLLFMLVFGLGSCSSGAVHAEQSTLENAPVVVDDLEFTFSEMATKNSLRGGVVHCRNVGRHSIRYAVFEDRPVFHLKSRVNENPSRPRQLQPGIDELFSESEDWFRSLDPGDSVSGRLVVGVGLKQIWVGLRTQNKDLGDQVVWVGPFECDRLFPPH